jgi:hypothetical protein
MTDTEEQVSYIDRTLKIKYRKDSKEVTVEGVCVAYNPTTAFLIKPEKRAYPDLVPVDDVLDLDVITKIEPLVAVKLKPVKIYDVRRHLLNYHGASLSEVNAWTDADAEGIHNSAHELFGPDLGHYHSDKNDK